MTSSPHRFRMLREWHSLKGLGGMILLEEVSLGSRFCGFKSPSWAQRWSLLIVFIWRCEFSATSLASCLPACCHVPHLDENGINLWNWKLAPMECFLRVGVVTVSIHSNGTLTKTPTMNSFGWIFHFGSRDETVTTTDSQSSEYFFLSVCPIFPCSRRTRWKWMLEPGDLLMQASIACTFSCGTLTPGASHWVGRKTKEGEEAGASIIHFIL